jgi:hypothetical protein
MVRVAAQGISQAVIAYIDQNVEIHSADGIIDHTLGFTGTETRHFCIDKISRSGIALKKRALHKLMLTLLTPLYNVGINLAAQCGTALKSYNSEFTHRDSFKVTFICSLK